MTGLAIVGPLFSLEDVAAHTRAFKGLAVILAITRIILASEYGVVLYQARAHTKYWPFLAVISIKLLAAIAFIGTFFSFNRHEESLAYVAW